MRQIILPVILLLWVVTAQGQEGRNRTSFFENFRDTSSEYFRYGSTGSKAEFKYKMGGRSQSEPGITTLSMKLDPQDSAGAGRGPEIISKEFTHFGTYSARLKVPDVRAVQPNTGAVVGYFTYHVDSIPGLSEIDFEWLVADPTIIYIGTWTGQKGQLQRVGRTINLAKGIIYNTIYKDHTGAITPLTGAQNEPEKITAMEGYDASSKFYIYGFDWYPDRIRWWIRNPEKPEKIVLWDYRGSQLGIPQNATHYRMNFWHTKDWAVQTNPNSLEKPKQPYELEVDWMAYEAFRK